MASAFTLTRPRAQFGGTDSHRSGLGHRLTFLRMPGVNRQGQAHIVSTAIPLPRSGKAGREVEATPWFRTWFSIDPQLASISSTINISIVFICASLVDHGRIICSPAIKNDSGAILSAGRGLPLRYIVTLIVTFAAEAPFS